MLKTTKAGWPSWPFLLLIFAALVVATWLRFQQWTPKFLAGDDLWSYMLYSGDRWHSPLVDGYFADSMQRYRFVFSSLMRVETNAFGKHIASYIVVNMAVHAASGLLVCLVAFSLCRSRVVSILLALIAVTARFGLYEVTQLTGQVENLSLLFCLMSIWAVAKAQETAEPDATWPALWKWLALFFAFLSFNSHERYVVLLPWLAIFFVLHRRAGTLGQRVAFVCVGIAMVAINVFMKVFVLKANLIQATGGVPLAINLHSILDLLSQAMLSIFGLNHGPAYLAAVDWTEFPMMTRVGAISFAVVGTIFLVVALFRKPVGEIHWPAALAVLAGLLLVAPVLTIRMEQRWELAPFCMLLLIVASGVARMSAVRSGRYIAAVMLAIHAIGAAAIETKIYQSTPNMFFVNWSDFAASTKRVVIDRKTSKPGTPVVFISDPNNCTVTLFFGGFFAVYDGMPRLLTCVSSINAADPKAFPSGTRIYDATSASQFIDLTDRWRATQ